MREQADDRISWEQIATEFDSGCEWLDSLGISIGPTRFGEYQRYLARLVKRKSEGDTEILDQLRYSSTMLEARKFTYIHGILRGYTSHAWMKDLLAECVKGPSSYCDESASNSGNRARNLAVELFAMAVASQAGGQLLDPGNMDVRFSYNGREAIMHCKRPMGLAAVKERLFEAGRQAERATKALDRTDSRELNHIIVVDLTRVINPKLELIHGVNARRVERNLFGRMKSVSETIPEKITRRLKRSGVSAIVWLGCCIGNYAGIQTFMHGTVVEAITSDDGWLRQFFEDAPGIPKATGDAPLRTGT